jgi:hypothetical protein
VRPQTASRIHQTFVLLTWPNSYIGQRVHCDASPENQWAKGTSQ